MVSKFVRSTKLREVLLHVYCILVLLYLVSVKHAYASRKLNKAEHATGRHPVSSHCVKQHQHLSEMRQKLLHTVNWGLRIEVRELMLVCSSVLRTRFL